jgi:hypothetical protein
VVTVVGWLRGDLAAGLEIGVQFGIFSFAVATWSALAERRRVARIVEASGRTLPGLTDTPWNGQGAAEEDEPVAAAETELPAAVNEPDASAEEPDQGEADQTREHLVSRSAPQRS